MRSHHGSASVTHRTTTTLKRWLLYGTVAAALHSSPALAQNVGRWGELILFPNIPVSAAMLPNGKVLTWSASQPWIEGDTGTAPSRTLTSLYDPWTGDITPLMETSMMADMLCSGISILGDGRIMMNGGSSSGHTALYDPLGNRWNSGPMMNIARG